MKKQIWKYQLLTIGINEIEMPKGAKILSLQMNNKIPCIWAIVNPNAEKEIRRFNIYGTGHNITEDDLKYIGTFQMHNDMLVFHLFEI